MSVEIGICIEDEEQLFGKIQQTGDLFDLLDEGAITCRGPETDSLAIQMDWVDVFEKNKEKLTQQTRDNIAELINIIFWSWRGGQGNNIRETRIENEMLDSAWNDQTCQKLLEKFEKANIDELDGKVSSYEPFNDFEEYKSFLNEYTKLLRTAANEKKTLYTLVFG